MARVMKLTHEMLTELLDFDPATGIFIWKVSRSNRVKPGRRAGVYHVASGGRYISIGDEKIRAHRLAFFYVNKRWPNTDVRPIDGNYDNCAIENLKEVSRVELQHGRSKIKTNTSGFQGVSAAQNGRFQSKITWNYQQIALGANFETAQDAGDAYQVALDALNTATCAEDIKDAVAAFRLGKRHRAIWNNILRSYPDHKWTSFEAFVSEAHEVPNLRFAVAPLNAALPIGPGNWQWALPIDSNMRTNQGRASYNRAHREANRDLYRDRDFRRNYGIDFAKYQQMLLDQKGVCAICEKPETKIEKGTIRLLSVDHDHSTDLVRGLLCANCNMAIGYACDDVTVLERAITYLRKHATPAPFVCDNPNRDWLHVATPGFIGTA
jgi:hypothetical protein